MDVKLDIWILLFVFSAVEAQDYDSVQPLTFKKQPAPDRHRCGVCPTNFQKTCAFDFSTNATHIFDNHCVMDLYNCIEGTGITQTCPVIAPYSGLKRVRGWAKAPFAFVQQWITNQACKKKHTLVSTEFAPIKYDKCLYFGNFAYVHGYKHEDEDYGEDHFVIKHSKKSPDFI